MQLWRATRRSATRRTHMSRKTCECGAPVLRAVEDLGCVDCGRPCCPVCAYTLESVAYCAFCAAAFLDVAQYATKR